MYTDSHQSMILFNFREFYNTYTDPSVMHVVFNHLRTHPPIYLHIIIVSKYRHCDGNKILATLLNEYF